MNKHITIFFLILIFILSCNIYSPIRKAAAGESTEEQTSNASEALAEGNFDKAIEIYDDILKEDPKNSEALLGQSQALLGSSVLEILPSFGSMMGGDEGSSDTVSSDTLSQDSGGMEQMEGMLNAVNKMMKNTDDIITNLEKITNGEADGKVDPKDPTVNLTLGMAHMMNALSFTDEDGDGEIKDTEVMSIGVLLGTIMGGDNEDTGINSDTTPKPPQMELADEVLDGVIESMEKSIGYFKVAATDSDSDGKSDLEESGNPLGAIFASNDSGDSTTIETMEEMLNDLKALKK